MQAPARRTLQACPAFLAASISQESNPRSPEYQPCIISRTTTLELGCCKLHDCHHGHLQQAHCMKSKHGQVRLCFQHPCIHGVCTSVGHGGCTPMYTRYFTRRRATWGEHGTVLYLARTRETLHTGPTRLLHDVVFTCRVHAIAASRRPAP